MRPLAATALAMIAGAAAAQTPPVVGRYDVEGTCPGQNATYAGTITITKLNALYSLRWVLTSGQVSTAQAVEMDGRLAIAYELDGSGGVMIARPTDTGWEGRWAYFNATVICAERWRRR